MSRRRTPRCRHCRAPIRFLWITFRSGDRNVPFDATPVTDATRTTSRRIYPVFGLRAWDVNDLTAEMQVMRGTDSVSARAEVDDLPWHRLHRCLNQPAEGVTE